jgi:hypothetical protein
MNRTFKCKKGYVVEILKTPAGYYIGTKDEEGLPNCRISGYSENGIGLIPDRQVGCIENEYCNGGMGCFLKEKANGHRKRKMV